MNQSDIDHQYTTTLNYLFKQLPMFQRVGPMAFKKDLTNIIALCTYLGQPQEKFPSIHIAGTNGKGSTAHILAAVLQASGKRVGIYSSPHYKDFRERIKINGVLVSKKFVVDFVATHKKVFEEIRPSFFEITVAMAFQYFALQKVEVAIIETGLGGRLDSTNIIRPILSIITNIGYDHQQFLGETLPEIASEKAGIIKPHTPIIIGEEHPETKDLFEEVARQQHAPLYFAATLATVRELRVEDGATVYSADFRNFFSDELYVDVLGKYQRDNVRAALAAIDVLRHQNKLTPIEDWDIVDGLGDIRKNTYFIGRWQQIGEAPMILCDSAHNKEGIKIVMEQVQKMDYKHLHIVFGMVKDKTPNQILSLLPSTAHYYFTKAKIPRGLEAAKLQEEAAKCGLKGATYVSVMDALNAAKRSAGKEDLIYVGGSIFVVAEVL